MGRGNGADGIFYGGEALSDEFPKEQASEQMLRAMAGDIFVRSGSKRQGLPMLPRVIASGEIVQMTTAEGEQYNIALAVVLAESNEREMIFRADVLQWGPEDNRPSHASFYESDSLRLAWENCCQKSEKLFAALPTRPTFDRSWEEIADCLGSIWADCLE